MRRIEIITTFKTISDFPSYKLGKCEYQCKDCQFFTFVPDEAWKHAKTWKGHLLTETLVEMEEKIVAPAGRETPTDTDDYCARGCGQFSHHPPTGECPMEQGGENAALL